jgi:cytoskeletal protein RodZ
MLGRLQVVLVLVALLGGGVAHAAPKAKGKPAATKPAAAKVKKGKDTPKEAPAEEQPTEAAATTPDPSKEENLKPAGAAAPKATDTSSVKVKEDKEGVKTYKFETVEVEGRLKSPQVIYFLRRVRAEFDAGALGHRSFLGELSDSRRSSAFR